MGVIWQRELIVNKYDLWSVCNADDHLGQEDFLVSWNLQIFALHDKWRRGIIMWRQNFHFVVNLFFSDLLSFFSKFDKRIVHEQ